MKRFCQECGHEANMSDKMCTNCGTKLIEIEQMQQPSQHVQSQVKPQREKKPMSKQQKIIISVVGALAILLIGFSIWANMYFSKDSTEKRFYLAVENQDGAKLENLLIHEDGSSATTGEINAFLKLADDLNDAELKDLVSVEPEGKFIGIFQMYKVFAVDQFAFYYGLTDGLDLKFNQTEIKNKKDSDGLTYGPLLPGIYTVNVSLDNDFGKSTTDFELELADEYSDDIWMEELPIGEANVYVQNYDSEMMSELHLLVNNTRVEVDEYGDSAPFGPIFLDGSTEVEVVANYPWGEVKSKPIPIDSSYLDVDAAFVTSDQLDSMKETLLTFGEEMQNAKAQLTTDVFTTATDILKDDFLLYEIDPLVEYNMFYNGKLNKIDINGDDLWFYDGLLMMHTMFDYSQAFYVAGEEPPSMEDFQLHSYVGFAYDSTSKEWNVSYIEESGYDEVVVTDTLKGSGTVYEPGEDAISNMETGSLNAELQYFMELYTMASIDAINFRDMSFVSDYLTSDGPRYNEAADYIDYLDEKGITEEYLSTQVVDVVDNGNGSYQVTTIEEFIIYYPDSEAEKSFETVTEVRNENGSWKIHKLISTTEI